MKKRILAAAALSVAAVLGVSGCSGDTGSSSAEGGDKGDITIGVFNGWPEGEAASYLWKSILEDKGYNVELEYADAGPVFAGVADGTYDFALDGWLPLTHKDYFEKFGDDIVDLGSWNEDAKLTFAVNADAPIDSLEELADNADVFGNKIIGIESGAGLTKTTQDAVIPEYGLEDMDFITSSTPAMLSELKKALDNDEDIVVTLWRPHWAYDAFDIKDLEDPKKALGEAEAIHTFTSTSFEEDFPEVNEWLSNFTMDSDLLFSLENVMYNTDEEIKDFTPVVEDWIAENQDYVDGLTK
ncbi:glycine betaine ABC transporter substrate-binding protein [Paramicrobacterium sp. CJ85]|uniref:glycine betaine ABC transporter substrate-binding protein n=1 Tax=Paramicrobacterium sp. CJ85 TaxID=3445355 RepID=UPI003F645B03